MKKLIVILLRATGIRFLLICYHESRLRAAQRLMKRFGSDTEMPVWCSERFAHHQRALVRLGLFAVREFTLSEQFISGREPYLAFCRLMRERFPGGGWSCSVLGWRAIVTAPVSQFPDWDRFDSEYDRQAA